MENPGIKILLERLDLVQNMLEKLEEEINDVKTCIFHENWSSTMAFFMTDNLSQDFINKLSSRYPESVSIALSTQRHRANVLKVKLSLKIVPIEKLFTIENQYNIQPDEDFINLNFFSMDMYLLLSELLDHVKAHLQNMIKELTPNILPSPTQSQSLTTILFQPRGKS